jgi:hypothetical protein
MVYIHDRNTATTYAFLPEADAASFVGCSSPVMHAGWQMSESQRSNRGHALSGSDQARCVGE